MYFKEDFFRRLTKGWYKLFFKMNIPAELLTLFRFAFAILVSFFILKGDYKIYILLLFFYQFVFLLDYVDGTLAKKQNRFSLKWVYLDRIFHYLTIILFLTGISILTENLPLIFFAFFSSTSFFIVGLIDTKNSDIRFGKVKSKKTFKMYRIVNDLFVLESPFSLFFFLVLFRLNKTTIVLYSTFYLFGIMYKGLRFMRKKSKEQIKKELSEQYFGEESQKYNEVRIQDPRRAYVVGRQSEITKTFLKNEQCKEILDVACGTGRFFYLYPGKIYGIDISSDQLSEAGKNNKKAILKVCDSAKICYPNEKFDVTITSQFIMHTPEYKKVISEMGRVTKKGGAIIIDFPNKISLSYLPTKLKIFLGKLRYYNLFTLKKIRDIARENNFEIELIEPTVIITPAIFPKSLLNLSSFLNKKLTKLLHRFTYVYYVKFRKK